MRFVGHNLPQLRIGVALFCKYGITFKLILRILYKKRISNIYREMIERLRKAEVRRNPCVQDNSQVFFFQQKY